MELQDRVVIVTGSGRGIGRALALEFARRGARVVCCARTTAEIEETAALINGENGRCLAVPADLRESGQVNHVVKRAVTEFGRIDMLVNNAARIPVIGALWEVDAEQWWDEITVNLRGPMLCCHAVLPHMVRAKRRHCDQYGRRHGDSRPDELLLLKSRAKPPDGATGQGTRVAGIGGPDVYHGARIGKDETHSARGAVSSRVQVESGDETAL